MAMITSKLGRGMGRVRLRAVSWLVLALLVAATVGSFVLSRGVVSDQERRLLAERTLEVRALLDNSIGSINSSLQVLGRIGASPGPVAASLFSQSADPLVVGATKALGVATNKGSGFVVVAAVGEGPVIGKLLGGPTALLAARAVALPKSELVSNVISDGGHTRLMLVQAVPGTRAVVYEESLVNQSQPVPSTPTSPFRELRAAVYASPRADPAQLVVTNDAHLPVSGNVDRLTFAVGADRWLLVVAARGALVGSLAAEVPWLFLVIGLAIALLATAAVETLGRRRDYALKLVAARTSDLEQTLGELDETRAFLERLLTAGPVVVGRSQLTDQLVTYVSPNVERIIGFTPGQIESPGFLADHIHPDEAAELEAAMARLALGASTLESIECRLRFADGAYRWISAALSAEVDDDGAVVAVLAYVAEVDARHRAEDLRLEAQEAAEAANESKNEFLSRMSHELRTPLNAVLGFGQLLEIEPLTDPQRDSVDHILKGGRHLLDLINEVLDISRIEAGELSLSPEPVLTAELVHEAVDLMRPLADQRAIHVAVDSSGGCDCYMFADRQRVKQVLLNLLSNSVKYNRPRGSIAVSCRQHDGSRVHISVTDTGMGIPAERLGLLFTPFERLGAEQTGEEGTGIGMALSKRLAEAMGGTLTATSTLGQGSTFTLDLPQVEGPVDRYERLSSGIPPAAERVERCPVVLHIEDNPSNLTLIERILAKRPGVELVAATHGRLGLELAREHRPALVLLDLHLPDMGGEQVLQRLREDKKTASIPVAIISADATPGQVQRLLSAGAVAYLTKPINVRDLLSLLDDALSIR